MLWTPVIEGLCSYSELNTVLSFTDLVEMHKIIYHKHKVEEWHLNKLREE